MIPAHATTTQKLIRARVRLLLSYPFFGTLCLRLKLIPGDLPTMATDGARIVYNPTFVDKLRPAELEGTFAHEVMHCALAHQCRRGERDPRLWNEAADLAINPILIANGFTLPAGALIDPAFANLSAEEIYARLVQKSGGGGAAPTPNPQQTNLGGGNAGGQRQTPGPAPPSPSSDSTRPPVISQTEQPTGQVSRSTSTEPGHFGEVLDAGDAGWPCSSQASDTSPKRPGWVDVERDT